MTKKSKPPVRRDEDFEQLDHELEEAMRALESINERTLGVLQQVEQGPEFLDAAEGGAQAPAHDPESPAGEVEAKEPPAEA